MTVCTIAWVIYNLVGYLTDVTVVENDLTQKFYYVSPYVMITSWTTTYVVYFNWKKLI